MKPHTKTDEQREAAERKMRSDNIARVASYLAGGGLFAVGRAFGPTVPGALFTAAGVAGLGFNALRDTASFAMSYIAKPRKK